MDGRNSTGSKVSLLNDSSDVAPLATKAHHQLPPLAAHRSHHHPHHHPRAHSRASSCTSTPSLSPQTPPLVRSDSSDSRVFGTPSPLTPAQHSFHEHHHAQHQHQHQHHHKHHPAQPHHAAHSQQGAQQYLLVQPRYPKMDDPAMSMYPPPDASNLAMPSAYAMSAPMPAQVAPPVQQPMQSVPQQLYRASNSPSSEPSRVSTVSAASNGARPAAPKKNQYPCPLAKQFNCGDYFTTSGHAARHAKKHTGKKDAFCPECNKAFTRKDNMEQHRRTHQNGRGASRTSGSSDDSKVKKTTKPAPKKAIKADPALEAAVEHQLAEQQQPQPQMPMPQAQMQPQPRNAPQSQPQQTTDPAILIPPVGGPYFLNTADPGPIHSLPMPAMNEHAGRPSLQRGGTFGGNPVDFFAPPAQMMGDPENLNFSYPSPGLSNGLNSLALAASEHRRLSEEKKSPSSGGRTP